jgi:hypothetical protein
MIDDFDPDDDDDELRRLEAEFHERAATVALTFAVVMAVATVVVLFWRCVLP